MDGLFRNGLYGSSPIRDQEGRLRADSLEMRPEIQAAVSEAWEKVESDNIHELTDFAGYKREFLRLFGFEVEGVDYDADVDPVVPIDELV